MSEEPTIMIKCSELQMLTDICGEAALVAKELSNAHRVIALLVLKLGGAVRITHLEAVESSRTCTLIQETDGDDLILRREEVTSGFSTAH